MQKEYAKLTKSEYSEPIFHKETVFDLIEQSEKSSTFTDEYILDEDTPQDKIQIPKQDAFGFASNTTSVQTVNDFDFSSIFAETEDNADELVSVVLPPDKTEDNIPEIEDETSIVDDDKKAMDVVAEDTVINDKPVIVEDTSEIISTENSAPPHDESSLFDIDSLFSENSDDSALKTENIEEELVVQHISEDIAENNNKEENTSIANGDVAEEDDDISSILNMSDDRNTNQTTKKRNINPRFKNNSLDKDKKINAATETEKTPIVAEKVEENVTKDTTESTVNETETFPVTPVLFDNPSFALSDTNKTSDIPENNVIDLDDMFASKTVEEKQFVEEKNTEEVIVDEIQIKQEPTNKQVRAEKKSSLIDDIFEVIINIVKIRQQFFCQIAYLLESRHNLVFFEYLNVIAHLQTLYLLLYLKLFVFKNL